MLRGVDRVELHRLVADRRDVVPRARRDEHGVAVGDLELGGQVVLGRTHLDAAAAAVEPDELVGTALLLCSDAGRWITGQTIHVDGGWVLRP